MLRTTGIHEFRKIAGRCINTLNKVAGDAVGSKPFEIVYSGRNRICVITLTVNDKCALGMWALKGADKVATNCMCN